MFKVLFYLHKVEYNGDGRKAIRHLPGVLLHSRLVEERTNDSINTVSWLCMYIFLSLCGCCNVSWRFLMSFTPTGDMLGGRAAHQKATIKPDQKTDEDQEKSHDVLPLSEACRKPASGPEPAAVEQISPHSDSGDKDSGLSGEAD